MASSTPWIPVDLLSSAAVTAAVNPLPTSNILGIWPVEKSTCSLLHVKINNVNNSAVARSLNIHSPFLVFVKTKAFSDFNILLQAT
jgi:hypothetical protein